MEPLDNVAVAGALFNLGWNQASSKLFQNGHRVKMLLIGGYTRDGGKR